MRTDVIVKQTRNRWYLAVNALYVDDTPSINWGTLFPAKVGTKHQRAYLLESAKGLIAAMIDAPRDSKGPVLAHGTVLNWFRAVRRLVQWMMKQDLWRFSSLSPRDVSAYIEHCGLREDGMGKVAGFTLRLRIQHLQEMWNLRRHYVGALRVNPATLALDASMRELRRSTWKALDERVALPLIRDAISWLNTHGEYLISFLDRSWRNDSVVAQTRSQRKTGRGELYSQIEEEAGLQALRTALSTPASISTFRVLREALTLVDGACVIILLFLVGMRIRELSRLDSNCLRHSIDATGNEVCHLHGIAAKQDGRARTWITSGPVIDAITYWERCYRASLGKSRPTPLIVNRNACMIPSPLFRTYRTTPQLLTQRMLTFANASFRENAPRVGRLHPHVARKTFARFVVLRDKRALETVAYHFGHVHRSVTDGHYVGSDIELAKLVAEEGRKDLAQGLTDLLNAPFVGGKAGAAMSAMKTRAAKEFKGRKGLQQLVGKLIDDGVQLAPCDWGYCVYSQAMSACSGDSTGPNPIRRSPDVCSGCKNFAVTEKHRPWWESRLHNDDVFLDQKDLPQQTVDWVVLRRANTERIIVELNRLRYQCDDNIPPDNEKDDLTA